MSGVTPVPSALFLFAVFGGWFAPWATFGQWIVGVTHAQMLIVTDLLQIFRELRHEFLRAGDLIVLLVVHALAN